MGLPLFKTPAETITTTTASEKSQANARSSIRRNRPCESRDHSERTNHNSRRAWGINAFFDPREYDNDDDTRRRINQYYNTRNVDSPSTLWNSRVLRIFNDSRERIRPGDRNESDHLQFPSSDRDSSNYDMAQSTRVDGTILLPTQPRRARTRRLRRMTGRHSLLSRPVLFSDSHPRLAPPISIIDTSSLNMDIHNQENEPVLIEVEDAGLEMNQVTVTRRRNELSDVIQQIRAAADVSSQNQLQPSSLDSWHAQIDRANVRGRVANTWNDIIWECPLGGISEHRPSINGFPDSVNSSIRDSSPCLSETTTSDKIEETQSNFDHLVHYRRDDEIEPTRYEISERRNFDRWRSYADVVSAPSNLSNQPEIVISNRPYYSHQI
ncbi:hypothetical protein HI914_03626 [Erysiphe necator]|uniref:Uncharacterized protein n=1 Tax=Uncinula necator TaxID=52586 RepID=A0A0B1PB36_UNCNE|nr:hypothetical protein HI914_03626 [Erysiphe necator]KHJ35463.1 hypothetical protein EV44_g1210 [Erysiphe necator]